MMSRTKLSGGHGHVREGLRHHGNGLEAQSKTNTDSFDIAYTRNEHLSRLYEV